MIARIGRYILVAASIGCGTSRPTRPTRNEIEPVYDPAAGGEGRVDVVQPAALSQCRTARRSDQLLVAFRGPAKRDASELSASEAPRILSLLEAQLCELAREQDPEGSLRTALGAGLQLEITALYFTRKDASRADAHVQLLSTRRADPGSTSSDAADALVEPPRWVLKLVRAEESGWRIVSAAAK
jgi:hypothetical protein